MEHFAQPHLPIGMFDSGFGGLTVMGEVQRVLPREKILYFGDTARLPYGEKSPEAIIRCSLEVVHFLIEKHVKILVIACNTACAHAFHHIQASCTLPVVGVIQPGAEKAVAATRNKRIGVLATKGTVLSRAYEKAIHALLPDALIFPKACPLFVPIVEEHFHNHAAAKLIVEEYLSECKDQKIDTLLLGCTHYPILRPLIQEVVGPEVMIVDSATSCAEKIMQVLDSKKLRAETEHPNAHRFFVTDDPDKFRRQGPVFLGKTIELVEAIRPSSVNL